MFNVICDTHRVKFIRSLEHAEVVARRENGIIVPLTDEAAKQLRDAIVAKACEVFNGVVIK